MEISNQEEVQMPLVQGWGGHGCDADNEMNINAQRRRVILMPSDSSFPHMRVMRTTDIAVTMLLGENLNASVKMNRTHIDLQILRVVTHQANQNAVTRHKRGNQQQVRFIRIILYRVFSLDREAYIIKR